jgi:hypothetical protein
MRKLLSVGAGLATALLLAAPSFAQTTFTGTYRLTVTFGAACRASIPSLSASFTMSETSVSRGTEIDGRPTLADDHQFAEVTLLRTGQSLHGPFGTRGARGDRDFISSLQGYLFLSWLVLDGTVTSGSGRPSARGSGFGFVSAGRPGEDYPSSLASCTVTDYTWALEPQ